MNSDSGLTSDMSLSENVEQALQANGTTSGHPLSVAAEGAMITLTGRVPSQDVKDAAIRTARSVAGVVDVVDDVTVGDDGGGLFGLGRDDGDDAADRDGTLPAGGAIAAAGLGWAGGSGGAGQGSGAPIAGAAIVANENLAERGGDTTAAQRGDDTTSMDDWQG